MSLMMIVDDMMIL